MNRLRGTIAAFAFCVGLQASVSLAEVPADPLGSPMWEHHAIGLFGTAPVMFDSRVEVRIPQIAENQRVFPVTVDARALKDVRRIVLLADLNPIPIAVDYTIHRAAPFLATRIKLDQRTPVRAALQTADGAWHVGGTWVDAAGGGCSAPPVSRVKGDWADHLGEVRGAAWPDIESDKVRLRMTFRHPMDTGLVENVPPYNIERLTVRDAAGNILGEMEVFGSVSEDPAFTVLVEGPTRELNFVARDTAGLEFAGKAKP
ncbi:MAG: quinoprotein dehydrogenase-associated SoxYZ-like carrier [Novosphingobium sp.]|uniref:quinoprotein dehydrogenase-associated SoxYZ-like carrier n=1 Tax=Novosphingobium sp. TaxID=1874826 RepID=UPI003B9C2DB7